MQQASTMEQHHATKGFNGDFNGFMVI